MYRFLLITTALFISIFFIGCSSPLEDIEITDFNLIRATFNTYNEAEINKVDNSTSNRKTIEAIFEDKNFHNMKLKGASVTVNNVPMSYDDNALVRRYKSSLPFTAKTTYTFVVTLVNGDTAMAVLTTDEIDFEGLSYNSELTLGSDYNVSWNTKGSNMKSTFWLYDTPSFSSLKLVQETDGVDTGAVTLVGAESGKYPDETYGAFKLTRFGIYSVSDKFRGKAAAVYSSSFVEGIIAK